MSSNGSDMSHPQAVENAPTYALSVATRADIPEIVALQAANHISRGGALSIEFPAEWFERSIADMPIVIARRGAVGAVLGL
jgi:hypothetical protein